MSYSAYHSAAFTTAAGVAIAANASVTVWKETDGALATLKADAAGLEGLGNPFSADANGRFVLFVAGSPGGYKITVIDPITLEEYTLRNVPIGTAQERDVSDYGADLMLVAGPSAAHDMLKIADPLALRNLKVAFSVASNALTLTLKGHDDSALSADNPGFVAQRNSPISDGGFTAREISAPVSLIISSGSTLGHTSGKLCPIYVYLLDDDGSQVLAASGSFLGETGIFSATAEGGAGGADTVDTLYADAAHSNLPGRLVAIAWSNQAAAGTWASSMTEAKGPPFLLHTVGEIVDYGGGAAPYGFFVQDGSNQSRTTYAKLHAKTGTMFGSGDGSTTFGIGDSRRRVIVGSGGTGTGVLGNAVGNTGGQEGVSHQHTVPIDGWGKQNVTSEGRLAVGGSGSNNVGTATVQQSTLATDVAVFQPSLVATRMIRWLGDL